MNNYIIGKSSSSAALWRFLHFRAMYVTEVTWVQNLCLGALYMYMTCTCIDILHVNVQIHVHVHVYMYIFTVHIHVHVHLCTCLQDVPMERNSNKEQYY